MALGEGNRWASQRGSEAGTCHMCCTCITQHTKTEEQKVKRIRDTVRLHTCMRCIRHTQPKDTQERKSFICSVVLAARRCWSRTWFKTWCCGWRELIFSVAWSIRRFLLLGQRLHQSQHLPLENNHKQEVLPRTHCLSWCNAPTCASTSSVLRHSRSPDLGLNSLVIHLLKFLIDSCTSSLLLKRVQVIISFLKSD